MQAALLLLACLGAVNAAVGVAEVDLVFPRNETYAPTPLFPVIFAFQNAELASLLNPMLSIYIINWDDKYNWNKTGQRISYDLRWANYSSSEPHYELRALSSFNKEGTWELVWNVDWESCTEKSLSIFLSEDFISNRTVRSMVFTTKNSAPEVDLVAATTNRNCSEEEAVALNVATTLAVPGHVEWGPGDFKTGGMCASIASTTTAPTPCRVKLDSAAASSMSSEITSRHCKATVMPGDSCPSDGDDKSAAQRLTGGAGAGLAAAFGALGYMMV